ncbi:acyl-CoA ligase (AMP-forming), exosortase A system-associated [Colwellia psychrerythraea]|uniref:Acyl-CoA ligase (AMP-forming), exosortase system type 1 associated protein n=1 Tax=Colwellia psychrerythraea TaxID=28229 RepID=A0A099KX98_COLPS|nr:acyl-CoA ligase (AMP-forming), exosortase A system-associated [Colwellia psychrerythraea]KGJ95349.1 acyl-CoA ligase (AMP-forming), exosortase system type 1 associated protein [Colwellia psychrerythraea]
MTSLVHELISQSVQRSPEAIALQVKNTCLSYAQLYKKVTEVAQGFASLDITQGDRIGIYLAKNQENVQSMFACSLLGAVFVPINPVLKAQQVYYIANDCQIKLLITNRSRLTALAAQIDSLTELTTIIVIDANEHELEKMTFAKSFNLISWQSILSPITAQINLQCSLSSDDLAAILYTSGSTGQPKGIMLSHTNIVLGAKSVSQYLEMTANDNILALLPLSFDYGLNQLTSCFLVGGKCVLLDYLLASDVVKAIANYNITGLAAVPALWIQLLKVSWPINTAQTVRYFTNSGGALPLKTLSTLQDKMPKAKPYLMYGLTEAFRSTFLSPAEIDNKPDSIGKAIPYAEVLVLRENGSTCDDDEVGELVHVGPLVALGYWQNETATAERFKETPKQAININNDYLAVFSGDYVRRDSNGFLYFVSRKDTMIKTSGYRVSPTELESILLQLPEVTEAAIIASPSTDLGQAIIAIIVTTNENHQSARKSIMKHCLLNLPNYMVPKEVVFLSELPRNANGKVDITLLTATHNKNYISVN